MGRGPAAREQGSGQLPEEVAGSRAGRRPLFFSCFGHFSYLRLLESVEVLCCMLGHCGQGLVSGVVWERACGQAGGLVGRLRGPARGLGRPHPLFWSSALLGFQMVVVNSSSPMAACSGPWETRGIEESVTTVDGNAESLYMQGAGRETGLDSPQLPVQGSEGTASSQEPGFSGCCLQPSPHPKPPSSMVSGPRSISRS